MLLNLYQIVKLGNNLSFKAFIFSVILLISCVEISSANTVDISYTSPKNGAKYLRPQERIIISTNEFIDGNTLSDPVKIEVHGKMQNDYYGSTSLSDDGKTILFSPSSVFLFSDTITVDVMSGIKTQEGNDVNPTTFTFFIRDDLAHGGSFDSFGLEFKDFNNKSRDGFQYSHFNDSLPTNFPQINILNSTNPSYGRLFFSSFNIINLQSGTGNENRISNPYLIIAENSGEPYFYRGVSRYAVDFKKTPDGNLSYYDFAIGKYFILDTSFAVIDSFQCGNGYHTDQHEIQFLENGHVLLMSYDPVQIDMSKVIPGGNANANVLGLVVQELDKNKRVVFQWRSWDDMEITEAINENLLVGTVDYVHGNSIEQDYDGNIILSFRHLDQIAKVNRLSGEIMWRFGGVRNEFTFLNDDRGFSHQHDARRVAPGRITLFDNGNFHDTHYSRAIEYELDEVNKTAKLVWQFDHNKDIYTFAMGNVQRLPNGNTLIGWGTAGIPNITEVDPSGDIVFELAMADSLWSYRAYRFNFNQPDNPIPTDFSLAQNYPNPFNPGTNINFKIPTQSYVTLKVYDLLGREVDDLVNNDLSSGDYNILWNAENLPSGVYFYTLITENYSDTKKMILLK